MTYADLLQESYESEKVEPVVESFAAIDSFMHENFDLLIEDTVDFDVKFGLDSIVFTEGAEGEEIDSKGTLSKIGSKIVEMVKKLIAKIESFLSKIPEAISKVVTKANAVLAKKSNKSSQAMAEEILKKYPDATLANDITVKVVKDGKKADILKIADELGGIANALQGIKLGTNNIKVDFARVEGKISLFTNNNLIDDKDFFEDKEIKAGKNIKDAYNEAKFNEAGDIAVKCLDSVSTVSKIGVAALKSIRDDLKGLIKDEKKMNIDANGREKLAKCSKLTSGFMSISMASLSFLTSILRCISKNSNVIVAAAAVEGKKIAKVAKKEEAAAEA